MELKRFFAKPDTWFDAGTEATLEAWAYTDANGDRCGIFHGIKDGQPDGEMCMYSEFDILEEK